MVPAAHVEGLYSCLDYYQNVSDPFSKKLLNQYDKLYPGSAKFTAGSACSGLYRGLKLWEAAVKEAGSLQQEDVIKALDHAKIAEGPGGPAEMVPGQHHVRMNMYIAQANNGSFEIVKSLGVIDPDEAMVPSAAAFGPGPDTGSQPLRSGHVMSAPPSVNEIRLSQYLDALDQLEVCA